MATSSSKWPAYTRIRVPLIVVEALRFHTPVAEALASSSRRILSEIILISLARGVVAYFLGRDAEIIMQKSNESNADSMRDRSGGEKVRVAERASEAIASASDSIKGAVDSVAERATAATQWASATVDSATRAPSDFLEAGAEYIRARPYVAVGAAFALGYLVAKLR
jgi:ElaB/YqjD/DUF883 family membrane-anchored ribosome-binding protein